MTELNPDTQKVPVDAQSDPHKHLLTKTPRTVLYGVGIAAAVIIILAVVSEVFAPGSVQRVAEATDTVVVQIGAILAALAVLVPPFLALFNLSDD